MAQNSWWGWKLVFGIVGMFLFLLLFLFPVVSSQLLPKSDIQSMEGASLLEWSERLLSTAMLLVAAVWVLFLGGTFASFLNVVAWRVPRGESILGSSHCPHCHIRLGFKDNIPFWGWLKNWGSCSNCHAEISPRYLVVELVLALIFLLVVAFELVTGGISLPLRTPDQMLTATQMFFEPAGDLVAIVALHLILILTLYTFVLIEIEQHWIPISIFLFGALFVVLLVVFVPAALVLPSGYPVWAPTWPLNRAAAILALGVGAGVGASFGFLLERLSTRTGEGSAQRMSLSYGLALVGMVLGWQSAILIGSCWSLVSAVGGRKDTPSSWWEAICVAPHTRLLAITITYLFSWRWLNWLS